MLVIEATTLYVSSALQTKHMNSILDWFTIMITVVTDKINGILSISETNSLK